MLSTIFEGDVELQVQKACVNVEQYHKCDGETYIDALVVEEEAGLELTVRWD